MYMWLTISTGWSFNFQSLNLYIAMQYLQLHISLWINWSFNLLIFVFQVSASGNFELQILEISNTNSHLLSGYCCGVPLTMRSTKTTGCPPCSTAFRLCLKEYQSTTPSQPGILSGCSFGNSSSKVIGGSSFVLTDPEVGSMVLPFTFRWTVSHYSNLTQYV